MVCGATLLFVGLKYHIVRSTQGLHLVPKVTAQLGSTYVDIREFSFQDWDDRPEFASALLQSEDAELREAATNSTVQNTVDDVLGGWGVRSATN